MAKENNKTKDPLQELPLRNPGQSLSEKMDDLLFEKLIFWAAIMGCFLATACTEWFHWLFKAPPEPFIIGILTLIIFIIGFWRIHRLRPQFHQLRLGLKGEKLVGQCLEKLRSKGYEVFHDIVGDGYNIDHAIVGPGGVFVIETKTVSKPVRGQVKVIFDGNSISINGMSPERNPVVQVRAEAGDLATIIRNTTGSDVFVRPVILYPGWYVEQPKNSRIWVLNAIAFSSFIENEDVKLSAAEISQISAGIAMHIRNREKKDSA